MVLSIECGNRKIDGHVERPTPVDYDSAPTPGATRGGYPYGQTDGCSGIYLSSDDSTSTAIAVLALEYRSVL